MESGITKDEGCYFDYRYNWGSDECDISNELCDISSWNVIKGQWNYDSTTCNLENTDSDDGNIVWFGSADGLTFDPNYSDDTFLLSTTMAIHSGYDAGLIFRTQESSTTNNEGPTYFLGLYPSSDSIKFGTMNDGWNVKHMVSVSSIEYDVAYTLTVHAVGDMYTIYFDGELVMDVLRSEFSTGSIGLRTFRAPTTFYSLKYDTDIDPATFPHTSTTTDEPKAVETTSTTTDGAMVSLCHPQGPCDEV